MAEVHVAGWRWAYRGQIPDDFIDGLSVDDREATWQEVLGSGGAVLVAEVDGRIVGFASVGAPDDPESPPGSGELAAIYLLPRYAGRGVGHALLQAAEDALRDAGYRHALLWVLETNRRARRFYERAGWSWDGTVSTHRFDCAERPVVRYVRAL